MRAPADDTLVAAARVSDGVWPAATTRSYVFANGTVANTNYIAIPQSAPHLAEALVATNFIASPGQQYARANPLIWGEVRNICTCFVLEPQFTRPPPPSTPQFPAYSPGHLSAASPVYTDLFSDLAAFKSVNTPNVPYAQTHQLAELDPAYGSALEAQWATLVLPTIGAQAPPPAAGR